MLPTGKVGAVRIGDLDVQVRPKISIARLLFLIGYAKKPGFLFDDASGVPEADLWPALAESLIRYTARALNHGPIQAYSAVDATLPLVRGRLRLADQVAIRPGQLFPLEVRHDEYTSDTPENRLLRTALHRMATVPRLSEQARKGLAQLDAELDGVQVITEPVNFPHWIPTRLNAHYLDALRIADIVLRHQSIENRPDGLNVASFVVTMDRVFEDFVTIALAEALARFPGRAECQLNAHLDQQRHVEIRADLVHLVNDRAAAVVDAKYKLQDTGHTNPDHFQILAYCTALGATTGCLVYAHGPTGPKRLQIQNSPINIIRYPLDLDAPPTSILKQIADLADEIDAAQRG
nr:hypothetical protein [Glycomyces sp. L485]